LLILFHFIILFYNLVHSGKKGENKRKKKRISDVVE